MIEWVNEWEFEWVHWVWGRPLDGGRALLTGRNLCAIPTNAVSDRYPTFLRYNDGEVYDPSTMATQAGIAHLALPSVSSRLLDMQKRSLAWVPLDGTLRADGAGGIVVSTLLTIPCTLLVKLECHCERVAGRHNGSQRQSVQR
jgi:hypothetical protein